MDSKVLTISIAAYNVEDYIDECLSSLVCIKNVKDIEILVIDDGGTDNTMNIAKKYHEKYGDTIRLIYKSNGGWGSAVNIGIKEAKGIYFKELDGDDYFNSENFDKFIDFLKNIKDNNTDSMPDIIWTPFEFYDSHLHKKYPSNNSILQMHSMTFKTRLLSENSVNLLEHCFYTDIELVFYGLIYAKDLVSFDNAIYVYRVGLATQSVSVNSFIKHYREHEKVTKRVIEMYFQLVNRANYNKLCDSISNNYYFKNVSDNFVYKRVLELVKRHFSILFMLEISNDTKNKILEFDMYLKNKFPTIYNDINLKRIKLLRKNSNLYYFIAKVLHIRSGIFRKIIKR